MPFFPELPLKGNYEENKYKLYFGDTGLFIAMLDDEASEDSDESQFRRVQRRAL